MASTRLTLKQVQNIPALRCLRALHTLLSIITGTTRAMGTSQSCDGGLDRLLTRKMHNILHWSPNWELKLNLSRNFVQYNFGHGGIDNLEFMDNSIPSTKNTISLLNPDDRLVLLDGDNLEGPLLDIGLLGGLTELPHRIDGDKDKTFIFPSRSLQNNSSPCCRRVRARGTTVYTS